MKHKEDIISSYCGIGKVTTSVLLAEMPELGTLDAKKIAALAGVPSIKRMRLPLIAYRNLLHKNALSL